MAGKLSELAALLGTGLAAGDGVEVRDVSDASMAATGTNKEMEISELIIGLKLLGNLAEDSDITTLTSALAAHLADTVAAHAASAVAFTPYSWVASTEVQAALQEMIDEVDLAIIEQVADANYTFVLGDRSKIKSMNSSSTRTFTVPPNSSVAFPIGVQIMVLTRGTGACSFVAGGGVTIESRGTALTFAGRYSSATLIKIDTDVWHLTGDLVV